MKGCRNCTSWQGVGEYLDREDPATAGQKVQMGLCRRHAPRPGTRLTSDTEAGASPWPQVASDDWCGEWEPKIN